jgi:tRNA(Ile)-lysidine synthase
MADGAILPDEVVALLAPFGVQAGAVAVAVSGGPDSMALAFCLQRFWGEDGRVLALIVEHGLRSESAAEAGEVADRLRGMGMEAEILPWQHESLSSRIHVKAREARYALLLAACQKNNIKTLFLAHHADDQAETVLMRFAKGSGIDGLAGMAPAREIGGVTLARPFLTLPKARLLATCEANGIPFVTDPSNEKDKYARGRLRRVMPLLAEEGFTAERLTDLGNRAREAKEALEHYTKMFLCESVEATDVSGTLLLNGEALAAVPRAIALRALAACLTTLNSTAYAPEREPLSALMAWLLTPSAQDVRTLHGCLVQKKAGQKTIRFLREVAAITDAPSLSFQETVMWDGRWRVTLLEDRAGLAVRPLGLPTHEVLDALAPALRRQIPSARARASLPSVWEEGRLVAIPSFDKVNQAVAVAEWIRPFWLV